MKVVVGLMASALYETGLISLATFVWNRYMMSVLDASYKKFECTQDFNRLQPPEAITVNYGYRETSISLPGCLLGCNEVPLEC